MQIPTLTSIRTLTLTKQNTLSLRLVARTSRSRLASAIIWSVSTTWTSRAFSAFFFLVMKVLATSTSRAFSLQEVYTWPLSG